MPPIRKEQYMRFTVSESTPKGAPYQVGRTYSASENRIEVCPVCERSAHTTVEMKADKGRRFVDCQGEPIDMAGVRT
jgi:hypothetical protein